MAEIADIAIFLDIESLSGWLKLNGGERLLNHANELGRVVVRRAYGDFSHNSVHARQNQLNALGFEFVHVFHPVKGKNSADIQIVVDVMESLTRFPDLEWFVLATGDSDFSPLFRRLRELGKSVLGVGPRSALSEAVKRSCNQFIYIEQPASGANSTSNATSNAGSNSTSNSSTLPGAKSAASANSASTQTTALKSPASAQSGAAQTTSNAAVQSAALNLLLQVLDQFPDGTTLSGLKSAMRARDPQFSEKQLGFSQFNKFLKSAPEIVTLYQVNNTWHARAVADLTRTEAKGTGGKEPEAEMVQSGAVQSGAVQSEAAQAKAAQAKVVQAKAAQSATEPTSDLYQQLLRKKGWRLFKPEFLWNVLMKLQHYFPQGCTRSEEFAFLIKAFGAERSRADLQSTMYILYKAGFTVPQHCEENTEPLLMVQLPASVQKLSSTIDTLILKQLMQLCKLQNIPFVLDRVLPLLSHPYTEQQKTTLAARIQTLTAAGHD